MNCDCDENTILEEIPDFNCPFDLKQIGRLAFEETGNILWDSASGGGLGNGVPQANSQVNTLADWQARLTALDNTIIVVTPKIGGVPIIEPGEAIIEGGGNESFLGVEEVVGTQPSKFSAVFKSIRPETEKALKKVACKKNLGVYLFLEGGRIACEKVEGTENHRGLRIEAMFVGDRGNEGYGTKDKNQIMFTLPAGWSENLAIVTPADFNPLYDL